MTVTRGPAGRAVPEDDDDLAALTAAAAQARGDARRAAQALRLARRARGLAPTGPATDDAAVDADDVDTDSDTDPADTGPADTRPADTAAPEAGAAARVSLAKPASPDVPAPVATGTVTDDDDDAAAAGTDADDDADDAGDDDADLAGDSGATRRGPRRVTVLATVFAVAAAAFAVVAIVVHVRAGDAAPTSPAASRDAALLAARQDIVVLNTLDYTDVDGGLQRWLGATTGTLHDQLGQVSDADKQAIAVSKSKTTASVLAAAATQVDAGRGAATVIASVQVVVTPDGGTPTTKRTRFSLTMQRVGVVWKIGAVQQVGVTLS